MTDEELKRLSRGQLERMVVLAREKIAEKEAVIAGMDVECSGAMNDYAMARKELKHLDEQVKNLLAENVLLRDAATAYIMAIASGDGYDIARKYSVLLAAIEGK